MTTTAIPSRDVKVGIEYDQHVHIVATTSLKVNSSPQQCLLKPCVSSWLVIVYSVGSTYMTMTRNLSVESITPLQTLDISKD